MMDMAAFRKEMIKRVQKTIKETQQMLLDKFLTNLTEDQKIVEEINLHLDSTPSTIDEFIKMKNYLENSQLTENIAKIDEDMNIATLIISKLEEYQILIDNDSMLMFLQSHGCVNEINNLRQAKRGKLSETRSKFKAQLDESRRVLLSDIEQLRGEIEKFKSYFQLSEVFNYSRKARELVERLEALDERAEKMNM